MPDFSKQTIRLQSLGRSNDGADAKPEQSRNALQAGITPTGAAIEVLDERHADASVARPEARREIDHLDREQRVERPDRHLMFPADTRMEQRLGLQSIASVPTPHRSEA